MSSPIKKGKKKKKNTFGATSPPFIDYLKDILRRYPDGGQILKELIQNADDAGASEVVFIHDERTYDTDSLLFEDLAKYQGPALYAFNNAVFTEEDWHGIQATGRSVKRNDPNRVGRFGIGFNSIYHITDVPYIFSSKYLGLLDPQETIFGDGEGGFRWSLDDDEDRNVLLTLLDQFEPLRDIVREVNNSTWEDTIKKRDFEGTLFRFPLRYEPSEVSDNLYDANKVVQLFDSFITDADLSLLFLRHVSSVSLKHIDPCGTVTVKLTVSLSSNRPNLNSDTLKAPEGSTLFKTISSDSPSAGVRNTQWLVTSYCLDKGEVSEIDLLAEKLCYRPQVDLAFPHEPENALTDGRLSCFLPLPNNEPNKTGLPVHINACFGLTDNRRHIKWQDEDQKNDEAAQWNELLMTYVLPHTYLKMILDSIKCCRGSILPAASVYRLWPNITQIEHKEKWHGIAKDILERLLEDKAVFSLAKDEKIWVTLSDAVFPANDIEEPAIASAVARVLKLENENLIAFPEHVLNALKNVCSEPNTLQWITPHFVRNVLQRSKLKAVSHDEKLHLLEYVLSDGKYQELEGLPLLPLDNGTLKKFTDSDGCMVLIDNKEFPRELLPFCKGVFISRELSPRCLSHLKNLATKETFNIINLDAQKVAELTKKHLPHDWKNGHDHVVWNQSNPEHPPSRWLTEFWKYLCSHWEELGYFVNLPLLPVESPESDYESVLLAKLQEKPTLVFQQSKHSSLSEHIQSVVRKVGGTVIKQDEYLKHHDIETFVLPPSPKSLLKVFLNLSRDQVIRGIHSASCTEKEEIKSFLSSLDSLSNEEQRVVSDMSLFQLMTGEYVCAKSKHAVILNATPIIPSSLPIPNSVVKCVTEADRRLLSMLKIELMDAAQLALHLVKCIEGGSLNHENEKKIMIWILEHGAAFFSQNVMLHNKCKGLTFIESEKPCQKAKASSLFDPNNAAFKKLFEPKFFPSSDYIMNQQMLQSLHQLGLRSEEKDISPENVLEVVKSLEQSQTHPEQKTWEKADALLRVLNENDIISKFSSVQLEQLQNMQWFPCENPHSDTKNRGFYKPCEIRHSKYRNVVGHVMPLVSGLNEKVCKQLGLLNPPPSEKVIENLSVLNSMSQTTPDLDKNVQFKTKLHDTYKFMQDHIELFKKLLKKISVPWLWIDSHFVLPSDVVLAYPPELDLSSYIEKVPEEYLPFEILLRQSGVKLSLSEDEIEKILHDVKDRIDQRNPPCGEPSELKVSINILNWMRKENKPVKDNTPVPVMAENQKFTLQHASTTLLCDISKEGLIHLKDDDEDFHVIHEEICLATAEWLKIPLLSTRILNPEFIGIEQCGQSEPITQRIKNILREYDEDGDIFKELLQNAEDAGASTCKFMVDLRKHRDPPETLIDSDMALCNGPCLWAFNDEVFSDDDWKNITKVGSASKEKKVETIGKFGIGFNAVYHVTDIPSILSGKKLLIFDPNVTHLKKYIQNKGNPGIKLDVFKERISRSFPAQFRSYEGIFDCDLSEKNTEKIYKGTLMKLPFRSPEESKISEISTKIYDSDRIMSFQQHLTHKSQTHLLFLRNVEDLTLQILPENATTPPTMEQMKTVVQITRKVVETIKIPEKVKHSQKKSVASLKQHHCKWSDVIDSSVASINEMIQNNVDGHDIQHWLLYSCFGTHCSLEMVQDDNELNMFSLPIGGIAVPLQKEPQTGRWTAKKCSLIGQVFSFLPLSIQTGLPVNVNGAFAVMSNRKSVWETGVKAEWNAALLKDAVTNAYITTLLILKQMSEKGCLSDYPYYTFWPDSEKVGKAFQPLVDSFYSAVVHGFCSKDLDLFSDGEKWCSLKSARFLEPAIVEHKEVGQIAEKIFLSYPCQGSCAVPLPSWVRKSMIKSGFKDIVNDRTLTWTQFFRDVVFRYLDALDPQERKTMILCAIDLNNEEVDELLKGHRCIPSQSGELRYIRTLVNPSGKVACLYDQEEGRFIEGRDYFCSPNRILRLMVLGMLNDRLLLEDVAERAGMISRIWKTDQSKATKRLQCLFELMQDVTLDQKSHHWSALQNTPFIPACSPLNTQLNNNVVSTLKKPGQVYNSSCHYLVNMTQYTVDHGHLKIHKDNFVLDKLGVCKSPPLHMVMRQLEEASKSDIQDRELLHRIAKDCYGHLNKLLSDQDSNHSNPIFIAEFAKSFPFVFVEDTFVHVTSVAKYQMFEAKPYLCVLPSRFSQFSKLWECVGVQDEFTPQQFAAVLHEIGGKYGSDPLSDSDCDICLDILRKGLLKSEDAASQNYLVPDDKSVLRPSNDLHYNDSPWMPVSADISLCHKLISRQVACHFGVRTTKHYTLQNHLDESFPFYAFGQHEELTVRIKNIIEAYPSKKDIIKELIQNADDAEASEIHFIWDEREHGTEKTFGEKWNSLQGPALCVYNNKPFTKADFQGIQKLGEGGKHGQCGKTGKYGLGFNSVYHLTDCPAILTGDKLCIFDPHVKYAEMATNEKPGCMYTLDNEFKEKFIDVYQTFLPSDFKPESGTMFRLPLRTKEMAAESDICKAEVGPHDMYQFMQVLAEDPEGLILFLKHIKKIQYHRIGTDGKLWNACLIEKQLSEEDSIKRANFQDEVQRSMVPCQVFYNMRILSNSGEKRQSQWTIAEQFGSFKPTSGQVNEDSNVSQTPQAAVAACIKVNPIESEFNGRAFCSLPLPGTTGLPVHVNGNFEVDYSRRGLWKEDAMSVKTEWNESLKLDIISPLFADLLKHMQMAIKTETDLGLTSLETRLYFSFLKFFPSVSTDIKPEWHTMINHVYRSIYDKNLPVIPVLHITCKEKMGLHSIKKYTVNWSNVCKHNPKDSPHFSHELPADLFEILDDIGMSIVPCSQKMDTICTGFKNAGVEVMMMCPKTVREYLKEKTLNDATKTLSNLPLPLDHTLVKDRLRCLQLFQFCMGDVDEENIDSVNGLPLLLTQDQLLRVFDHDLPRQYSKFWDIFEGQEAAFADYNINSVHSEKLQKGGYLQTLTIPVASELLAPVLKKIKNEGEPPKWLKKLWLFFDKQIKLEDSKEKQAILFKEIKKSFFNSPVLPVISPSQNNKHFLKTMKDLSSVIGDPAANISKILFKLGLMTVNDSFFARAREVLCTHLMPELLKSDNSNAVLENVFQIPHSKFKKLPSNELDVLQNHFQTGIITSEHPQDYQRMFRSLPLFLTVQGERQSIEEQNKVFILDAKSIESFPNLFNIHISGHVFLKFNLTNEQLSRCMNIGILTDLDFYVRFLLPAFNTFTETQIVESVQLLLALKHHKKYREYKDEIVARLASVRFIRDIHGTLQLSSYFFDDKEPLYIIMVPKDKFVPSKFWKQFDSESVVRGLLKKLGMKHTVSDNEIIGFAHEIESEAHGKTSVNELMEKSSALFEKAVEYNATNGKCNLLKKIANIKFIFPLPIQKELSDFYRPFAGERDVVAIKGSLMEKQRDQQYLIWSSMPILPTGKLPPHHLEGLVEAGAFDQPPCDSVAQNLKNICESECQNDDLIKIRKKVFCQSYAYLQSEQAKDFNGSLLQDVPVVLVENDTVLVQASQAVLSLHDCTEFRPYLYKINSQDALYAEFFKRIGVEETPTIRQYCTVLKDIYMDSNGKETLNPNQELTFRRAVQHLFHLMKAQPEQEHFQQDLYLPSADGKLHKSEDLYFNDTVFQTKRLEDSLKGKLNFLMNLEHCYLGDGMFEHQKLLQLLPKDCRPRMLSKVTSESLVSCSMKPCEYKNNCEFSGWFERHLKSGPFLEGLKSLIRQQSKGSVSLNDAIKKCQDIFEKLKIICCETLETELFLGQESLAKTTSETQVYVKKENQSCSFFLKHSDSMDFKIMQEVVIRLSKEINSLLENILCSDFLLALGQLLSCDSQEEVEKTLANYSVHYSPSKNGLNVRDPGSQIQEEWYDALDMSFKNNYERGEYVGFRKTSEDKHFYYAVVVERLDASSESQHCCKYKIQISNDEFAEVSSLDLYQFKREKTSAPDEGFSGEIELVDVPESSTKQEFPKTFEEIKNEIDKCLSEIWMMPKNEQQKAIKRLYLRWHPDKNPGQEQLANEAFKYLLNRLNGNGHGHSPSRQQNGSGSFSRSWNFEDFYSQWNSEASRHRQGRKKFYRNTNRSHYNFWSYHQEMPRPDKEEAKRWYLQAQCDLGAAHYDSEAGRTEWCLFKVHQAVEKALIATEYRRCGKRTPDCSISGLALKVSGYSPELSTFPVLVNRLKRLGVDGKTTQYPNYHPSPKIPNNAFQPENEKEALNIALELLQKVDSYLTF